MASKKSKSIFRQPNAKHFQVVHRSQRDPLIHDPEASQHVLKPFVRENEKKGKTRSELEDLLGGPQETSKSRANVGEASLYGIYYDDTEYDYMQHLRTVGLQEAGVDSVLIEAPSTSQKKKDKGKGIQLKDLPDGVLASQNELPQSSFYERQQNIPASLSGFQPDMNPHLRQALEALEDDAFVDDGLGQDEGDDFFGELVGEGERDDEEDVDFEFYEYGPPEDTALAAQDKVLAEDETWQDRFKRFKQSQEGKAGSDDELDDDEGASEAADTVASLPMSVSVIGGSKRRRKRRAESDASGYSMSSSSLFRGEGLKTLDEAFDQLMKKEYGDDDDDEDDETYDGSQVSPPSTDSEESDEDIPNLITPRPDFTEMVDTFLDNYELVGGKRKLRQKLEGETGADKLDVLRRAMGIDERVRVSNQDDDSDGAEEWTDEEEEAKEKWDCETILTTYSNLENHPRLIRVKGERKPIPKIRLDPKTGLPSAESPVTKASKERTKSKGVSFADGQESDEDSDDTARGRDAGHKETISRPRDESPNSKAARKKAVKAERAQRRVEKKEKKQVWGGELKKAKKREQGSQMGIKQL